MKYINRAWNHEASFFSSTCNHIGIFQDFQSLKPSECFSKILYAKWLSSQDHSLASPLALSRHFSGFSMTSTNTNREADTIEAEL